MLQQLARVRSHRWIFGQANFYKVSKFIGPLLFDRRWVFFYNIEDHTTLGLTNIWWIAISHFHGKYAKGPNVYFSSVCSLSSNEFWCHPTNSANLTYSTSSLFGELNSIPEICKRQKESSFVES